MFSAGLAGAGMTDQDYGAAGSTGAGGGTGSGSSPEARAWLSRS
jgi:hypothetical protein